MNISDGSLCVVEITFRSDTRDFCAGDYVKYDISSLDSCDEDLVSILNKLSTFVMREALKKSRKLSK